MAQSARSASLQAQRNPYSRLRILSPASTALNTIAKKTANSELSIMTDRYNAGLVSNTDFRDFLTKQLTNIGLSEQDKSDIQLKIQDFDTLVRKDQLEAAYKSAPENSLAKVNAATALSNFYSQRAATLVAGTPAQSTALENAGQWQNTAIQIQNTVEKQARSNLRYAQEQKIYQLPTGSSEQAYAKADMYQKLGDQATKDGDPTEANKYYAQAQQFSTLGDEYVTKEGNKQTAAERSSILDYLNNAINAYHDGTATAEQIYQALSEVDNWAVTNNDTSLMLKVNSESDRIAKIEAKGGLNRGTVGAGLPVVLKGSGKGGGTSTNWDQADYEFSNGIRALDAEYKAGLSNASEYGNDVGVLLQNRQKDLMSRLQTVEAVAADNPNAKIVYNGKKTRAGDVVDAINQELDGLDGQVQAYNNGTFTLLEVPPDQFNKSGTVKKSGKNVATYQLVDYSAIPPEAQDNYVMDKEGILHMVQGDYVQLTPDQLKNVFGGYYTDPTTNQSYKVITDPNSGLATIRVGSRVDLYDPTDRTKKVTVNLQGNETTIPGYEETFKQQNDQMAKEAQAAAIQKSKEQAVQVPNMDLRTPVQKVGEAIDKGTAAAGKVIQNVAQAIPDQIKQPVKQASENIVAPVKTAVEDIKSIAPVVLPKVQEAVQQSPISYVSQKVNAPTPSSMGNTSTLSPITGQPYKPTIQVNGQTMVKQYDPSKQEITYQKVQPAPYLQQNKQATQPSIGTKIINAVKQSPFDFLKKSLGF